jgi:methionyl-tRNA formyltransferase
MLRIAFFGRGEFGRIVLKEISKVENVKLVCIFECLASSEVKTDSDYFRNFALDKGIPYYFTNKLNDMQYVQILNELDIDLAICLLWINTLGDEIISTSKNGFLNIHGSLLPQYRGNASQNWAILNSEKEIGVTCHLMKAGELDSGPILFQESIPINLETDLQALISEIYSRGLNQLLLSISEYSKGIIPKQFNQKEESATFGFPRLPRDGQINWEEPSSKILTLIRATSRPYPGAYTWFCDVKDSKIKKLTIFSAHISTLAFEKFYAVPGHLIRIPNSEELGIVCGDFKLLVLEDVFIDSQKIRAVTYFKSVRQRFGLDIDSHVADLTNRIQALETMFFNKDN